MMSYKIKDLVFIVDGAAKSCIYDCNENRTYWIDHETSSFFRRVVNNRLELNDSGLVETAKSMNLIEESTDEQIQSWPDIEDYIVSPRNMEFAWIELTNQCNLRCTHCYNETLYRKKKKMTFEDFVYVVDELKHFGIKEVQLIGGEPFMLDEDELFKILAYASKSFRGFEVFFNGTMTSKQQLERIKDEFPNCKIALSLHSFIREEHEKITQIDGSYDKTVETLHNLQELKMPFRYVGIYAAGIKVGKELDFGVPYKRDYIRLTGRGNLSHYDRRLLLEKITTPERLKFHDLTEALKDNYKDSCFANYLYIGCDLNVYPCVMERRLCHGNLRNKALSEIIDNKIINLSKKEVDECNECEFRYLCKDCRPDSLSDNPMAKPWYCSYDVYKGEWTDKETFVNNIINANQKTTS